MDTIVDCQKDNYYYMLDRSNNTIESVFMDITGRLPIGDLIAAWGDPSGIDSYTPSMYHILYWDNTGVLVYTPNLRIELTSDVAEILWTVHSTTKIPYKGLYR
jgi:hypothetical protein